MAVGRSHSVAYLFTDIRGFLMQVIKENAGAEPASIPLSGSLIPGWQDNHQSDLILCPDPTWRCTDPFSGNTRDLIFANPIDPGTSGQYSKDVRSVALRAELTARQNGHADEIFIGPELEFYLLKGIKFSTTKTENFVTIQENDGWDNNCHEFNNGHRMGHTSMHLATCPVDQFIGVRKQISDALIRCDMEVLHHLHEAGPSQQEISVMHKTLLKAADESQLQKMMIKSVADTNGLTATFMPRPLAYSECSGMHVNISMWKDGKNRFFGGAPNEVTDFCRSFIAGVMLHIKALNAITNPICNSYRRLNYLYSLMSEVGYGYRNRSTIIRIPHFEKEEDCRLELRFPDGAANPYLAFSALTAAGIDGFEKSLEAPDPITENVKWYERPLDIKQVSTKTLARDLFDSLHHLHADREFLTRHGVFSNGLIDAIIKDGSFFHHWQATTPAPQEFQVFYSI